MQDHLVLIDKYCNDVISGRRVTGRLEQLAVRRYLEDQERATDPDGPFYFDADAAERACSFFPLFLKHTDGSYAGDPFELYDFQAFTVPNLWGFRRRENHTRRFREAFYSLGRGNGKTPFGAGLALLAFGFDYPPEPRAEVYAVAVKRDQARIAFNQAKRYVSNSPHLKKFITVSKDNLAILGNDSKFEPLSSDGKSMDGLVIHFVLRDEVHAWTEQFRDSYEKIETALAKRDQPLAITTTTAGNESSKIWQEQYTYATRVLDKSIDDDNLFVLICAIDDDDNELDENVWAKANPMLEHGVVKIDAIRTLAKKAQIDPAIRNQLRRYYCNKIAYSTAKPITPELWARGDQSADGLDSHTPHAGVDLGWCEDFAAIGYCWPLDLVEVSCTDDDGETVTTAKRRYKVDADVFIPRGTKRDLTKQPFADWIARADGRVSITRSQMTDTSAMYSRLSQRSREHGIKTLAFDPNNAREFAINVAEMGIETFSFSQSHAKYNEPIKEFLIALNEGRIFHGGNDVLGWFAQNMVEEENSKGLRMPAKGLSTEKIDAFVAVLMAFSEAMFAEKQLRSIYETRGPIIV